MSSMTHTLNRRTFTRSLLVALAAAPLVTAMPRRGFAAGLDTLLAQGKVGERFDGFAQARDPSAQGTVDEVNAKRLQVYTKRAGETGESVADVGRVYFKKLYDKADPGTWFLLENGNWVQK